MNQKQHRQEIESLEKAFWQSIVDRDANVATGMLTEPALMVSGHGAHKFDHAGYEKMAANEAVKLLGFKFSDMDIVFPTDDVAVAAYHVSQSMEMKGEAMKLNSFDTTTWIRRDGSWKCVAHTESLEKPKH